MEKEYQEYLNQPYFKINNVKPLSYEQWLKIQDQGEIRNTNYKFKNSDKVIDTKTYLDPIKGAKYRWFSSMKNDTNSLKGISKTFVPAFNGALLISGIPGLAQINGIQGLLSGLTKGAIGYGIGDYIDENIIGTPLTAPLLSYKAATTPVKNIASKIYKGFPRLGKTVEVNPDGTETIRKYWYNLNEFSNPTIELNPYPVLNSTKIPSGNSPKTNFVNTFGVNLFNSVNKSLPYKETKLLPYKPSIKLLPYKPELLKRSTIEGNYFENSEIDEIYKEASEFPYRTNRLIENKINNPNSSLYGKQISDILPEIKYVNGDTKKAMQLWAINNANLTKYLTQVYINDLIRDNPFKDNPLLNYIKKDISKFVLDSKFRPFLQSLPKDGWDSKYNQELFNLGNSIDNFSNILLHYNNNAWGNLHRIQLNQGNNVPMEYSHLDMNDYYPEVPVKYFTGNPNIIPENISDMELLQNGLLGRSNRSLTNIDIQNILKNEELLETLQQLSAKHQAKFEGSVGTLHAEDPVDYLISQYKPTYNHSTKQYTSAREFFTKALFQRMRKGQRSGFIPTPHSLSLDSFRDFERLLLQSLKKDQSVPLFKNHFDSNAFAKDAIFEYNPIIVEYIKNNPSVTYYDYVIQETKNPDNSISYSVKHGDVDLGIVKKLSSQQVADKYNKSRRELYRKIFGNEDMYPGDIEHVGYYMYNIPYPSVMMRQLGGILNKNKYEKN